MINSRFSNHISARFLHEAKQLLSELRTQSIYNREKLNSKVHKKINLTACKKVIAERYFDSAEKFYDYLSQLKRFEEQNYSIEAWCLGSQKKWREGVYKRQFAAIKKAEATGLSLRECADDQGVDFDCFHFSRFVFDDLLFHIKKSNSKRCINSINFSNLSARNCFIEQSWVDAISSFNGADLHYAKFYSSYVEDIRLGINCFQANFTNANLNNADLRSSYLRESNFRGACMHNTNLIGANLFECNFSQIKGEYIYR